MKSQISAPSPSINAISSGQETLRIYSWAREGPQFWQISHDWRDWRTQPEGISLRKKDAKKAKQQFDIGSTEEILTSGKINKSLSMLSKAKTFQSTVQQ